jgi:chitinase
MRGIRRRISWIVAPTLAAAGLAGAFAVAASAAGSGGNLLTNPGFETGDLTGWTCDAGTGSVVTSPVHSGSYALAGAATSSDDAQCAQTVSVQPDTSYTLTGWVQGDYVFIGASGGATADTWTPAASSWQQLSLSFTTASNASSVTIYLHGWYGEGTYYADDIALSGPGGPTTPPTTPPTTTPTTTPPTTTPPPTTPPPTTPPPTTPPPTTQPPGGGGLPAHILEGYWQDFTNSAPALRLSDVPTTYNVVAVAFGVSTSTPGQVGFSVDSGLSSALGGYTQQDFTTDIQTLHSRGQKVILSVGGANGSISVDDSTSASNFASSVYALMQQYGFDGVDIDLENGVNPTYMAQALDQLSSDAGSNLIITMAPQTVDVQSTGDDYLQLALKIKNILTVMNTQYYNSGSMDGCDGNVYSEGTENFLTALACIQLQGGLNPNQIGLGLPATSAAAGSGYVDPSIVNNALDCLDKGTNCGSFVPSTTYPGLRGAMDWSINWDDSSGYAFANTVSPHLGTLN